MANEDLKHLLDALRSDNAASAAETRRHFDSVAEQLDKRFDLLADAVTLLDERVGREADRLGQNLDRNFAETQAMIHFSHA